MRLLKNLGILGLATATVLSSCTIQKRTAMPGYHVEWRTGHTVKHDAKATQEEKVNESFAITPVEKSAPVVNAEQAALVQTFESESASPVSANSVETAKATEVKTASKSIEVVATSTVAKQSKVEQKASAQMKKLEKKASKIAKKGSSSDDAILYYILAFFIPFLAVGLVTNWEVKPVVINILLCCLCGIPGIIHAFIVVSRNV